MALYQGGSLKDGGLEGQRDGKPCLPYDDQAVLTFSAEITRKPAARQIQAFFAREDFSVGILQFYPAAGGCRRSA